MVYREIRPHASAQRFVDRLWVLECSEGLPQRVVPDGRPELILNVGNPLQYWRDGEWIAQPRVFLAGQICTPLLLRPCGPSKILGIRFHPHGAAQLFGIPIQRLTSRFTPVSDLSPRFARSLEPALDSQNPVAAVESAIVRQFESMEAAGDGLVAEAVGQMTAAHGRLDLFTLTEDLSISVRQFERRFAANVGLTPKLFCRIERFRRVFDAIESQSRGWAETALECGYFDQAHLIRDFKAFSGETPTTLLGPETDLAKYFMQM